MTTPTIITSIITEEMRNVAEIIYGCRCDECASSTDAYERALAAVKKNSSK